MDTKKDSATAEVPSFKIARVGNKRKRKGGAFSFLRGGAPRGAWSGAAGGSGASAVGGAGFTFGQAMMSVIVTCVLGAAGVQLGKMQNAGRHEAKPVENKFGQERKPVALEGDTANLPSTPNTISNSLGYLSGSVDGLTPEERAKKAADAAEAQRKADEAAAQAEAVNPDVDPAALLASAQADGGKGGKGGFGKKFGALSTSMGGSALAGGAGMSGGMNRPFAPAGVGGKGSRGQLSASTGGARPTQSRSARAAVPSSKVKGFARRQLANANLLSQQGASATSGVAAAYTAGVAFDNNDGAGTAITGAGVGVGVAPTSTGGPSPTTGGPLGNGAGSTPCTAAGYYVNASGACVLIPTPPPENVTPWQKELDLAQKLLMLIAILAAIALVLDALGWVSFGAGTAASKIISAIIGVLAVVVCGLGLAIMAKGGWIAGLICTGVGGYIAAGAFTNKYALTLTQVLVGAAAGSLLSACASSMGGSHSNSATN